MLSSEELHQSNSLLESLSLEPPQLETIVQFVLERRKELSERPLRVFKKLLKQRINVTGARGSFRSAFDMPSAMILPTLIIATTADADILRAVVCAWADLKASLRIRVCTALQMQEGADCLTLLEQSEGLVGTIAWSRIQQDLSSILEQEVEADVRLMVSVLTGRAIVPDSVQDANEEDVNDKQEAETGELPEVFQRVVYELSYLPPESLEWEQVDQLVQVIHQIAESKRTEITNQCETLRTAIKALQGDPLLDLFEQTTANQWDAANCRLSDVLMAIEQVEELQTALQRYHELDQQYIEAGLAERTQLRHDLETLGHHITKLHNQLESILYHPLDTPPDPDIGVFVEENSIAAEPIESQLPEKDSIEDTSAHLLVETEVCLSPDADLPPESVVNHDPVLMETAYSEVAVAVPEVVENAAPESESAFVPAAADEMSALIWQLISAGDVAGAYWYVLSMEAVGERPIVPSPLLLALYASELLTSPTDSLVGELITLSETYQPDRAVLPQLLLGTAAALKPTLLAGVLFDWLTVEALNFAPFVRRLVEMVRQIATSGLTIDVAAIQMAADAAQLEEAIHQNCMEAGNLKETALQQRNKFQGGSEIWRAMVGPGGELYRLLDMVEHDHRDGVKAIATELAEWDSESKIIDQITAYDAVHRPGKRALDGTARQQLKQDIKAVYTLIAAWCEQVKQKQLVDSQETWALTQVRGFYQTLKQLLPQALDELTALESDQSFPISIAARCLQQQLYQLGQIFLLPDMPPQTAPPIQPWLSSSRDSDLNAALQQRLKWMPGAPICDDGTLAANGFEWVKQWLETATEDQHQTAAVVKAWLSLLDYRFVPTLLKTMSDDPLYGELNDQFLQELEGSRFNLSQQEDETSLAVEQGVVDGIIADDKRARYIDQIQAIAAAENQNFRAKYDQLKQIVVELQQAREMRKDEQQKLWLAAQKKLEASLQHERLDSQVYDQITGAVEAALRREDTRLVDEYLGYLRAYEAGEAIDLNPSFAHNGTASDEDVLLQFQQAIDALNQNLNQNVSLPRIVLSALKDTLENRSNTTFLGQMFAPFSRQHLRPAETAVQAWLDLKQTGAQDRNIEAKILSILRFLGFSHSATAQPVIEIKQRLMNSVHAVAQLSAGDLARPIPQFGSESGNRYDVVCVWTSPNVDTLTSNISHLKILTKSVIVLYLGRLDKMQRQNILTNPRARTSEPMAILDELLLAFLITKGVDRARLPEFLACALPYAALNPYTPYKAGDVPKEMFFGRRDFAKRLMDDAGSCIVYGGRQLGKSALLRYVEGEFHNPTIGHYARVEDIKSLGSPHEGLPPGEIWLRIRDTFKDMGLLSAKINTDKPADIQKHVTKLLRDKPTIRVLMLFDEADNFLEADHHNKPVFAIVDSLRQTMADTGRRFKVVFAGLHSVQQFEKIPNQPLAHFGAPICVGPLAAADAQDLVRQPLEALGYRIDNELVLRILSYTNYHPGLIQLFCHKLVDALVANPARRQPPFAITRVMVDRIYLLPDVRDEIRKRFEWTLALDERYQAIAWSMIYDQFEPRDSYARAYTTRDIQTLVLENWPNGFKEVDIDHLSGLLEEMRGLGVLVKDYDGYRLRSPNLVRLLGTEGTIENNLGQLQGKEPDLRYDQDNHHAPMNAERNRFSPLTYAQERMLNLPQFGVCLIHTCKATGQDDLLVRLEAFLPRDLLPEWKVFHEIKPTVNTAARMKAELNNLLDEHPKDARMIVYQKPTSASVSSSALAEIMAAAVEFCHQRQSNVRWVRIFFVLTPEMSWQWLSLNGERRSLLENQLDAVVTTQRWNIAGIKHRLIHSDKMDNAEIVEYIMAVTGGWPMLLNAVFKRSTNSDPRSAAQGVEQELLECGPLFDAFKQALVFNQREVVEILSKIKEFEKMSAEDIAAFTVFSQEDITRAVAYLQHLGCIERTGNDEMILHPFVTRLLD